MVSIKWEAADDTSGSQGPLEISVNTEKERSGQVPQEGCTASSRMVWKDSW